MRLILICVGLMFVVAGCAKQKQGQCLAPKQHLKMLYKPKSNTNPFSHSFCVVCNTNIEPSEYAAWAEEMGSPQAPTNTDDVHPCLYVYSGNQTNIDSFDSCKALVCNGGAKYNDMVGKGNSNINVNPILGLTVIHTEQWVLDEPEVGSSTMVVPPIDYALEPAVQR